MFAFLQRFAWFKRDETPLAVALRAIDHGNFEQAELLLTELISQPDEAPTPKQRAFLYNKRGITRIHRGQREQAKTDFEAALSHVENFPPALTNLGNMLFEEEQIEAAIASYEAAIKADDDYSTAHFNLSAAYKRQGRHAEAVQEFRRSQRSKKRRLF